jgi:hypothetical protein
LLHCQAQEEGGQPKPPAQLEEKMPSVRRVSHLKFLYTCQNREPEASLPFVSRTR